jgi:hypothetical protein
MASYQDHIGVGLCDACRDSTYARGTDELDANARARVDLLQVIDELGKILDRLDVVVRRR